MKIRDNRGNVYDSARKAGKALGVCYESIVRGIRHRGYYESKTVDGLKCYPAETEKAKNSSRGGHEGELKEDSILDTIAKRYSLEELTQLAKGEGIQDRRLRYEVPVLKGQHFRIGVMSDTHIGSVYAPDEWLDSAIREMEAQDCDLILHAGDVTEGLKVARLGTQIFELSRVGYKAQRDRAVEAFGSTSLPVYFIGGNHDRFFSESTGCDIVEDICDRVPNATYLGNDQADLELGGVRVRLFHGGDGSSYATSYRLQKLCESYGDEHPDIVFAGHVHKYCHIYERDTQLVSVPTLQKQTDFMRGRKLAAHTGFLIVDFETDGGRVVNFSVKLYPLK